MMAYETLAAAYDRLTTDVPYQRILSFGQHLLAERGFVPRSVLDLACGSGSMSVLLARAGYEVIGVDMSEEMLTQAQEKVWDLEDNRPFFVRQKMQRLRLPGTVDWVFSGLDSINYLTDPKDCQETFRRVYGVLNAGGYFLFDVNTPHKFRAMDGQVYLDEDEDVFCVWRTDLDRETNLVTHGMDIFTRQRSFWRRDQEEHLEYVYDLEDLHRYLVEAGFSHIERFGDLRPEPPAEDEGRVYFLARK